MPAAKKGVVRTIAAERISILFGLAQKAAQSEPNLMHRYVAELRKICAHYKVKVPARMKNSMCYSCNSVMVPGVNASVRLASSKGYVAYTCASCGSERHVHYK